MKIRTFLPGLCLGVTALAVFDLVLPGCAADEDVVPAPTPTGDAAAAGQSSAGGEGGAGVEAGGIAGAAGSSSAGVPGGAAGAGGGGGQGATLADPCACEDGVLICPSYCDVPVNRASACDAVPTLADYLASGQYNWVEAGCGELLLGFFNGTSSGNALVFDRERGTLVGGHYFSDGVMPCVTEAVFGDVATYDESGWPPGGLRCPDKEVCRGVDAPDCLPGASGAGGAGGATALPQCQPGTLGSSSNWEDYRRALPWTEPTGLGAAAGGAGGAGAAVDCTGDVGTTPGQICQAEAIVAEGATGLVLSLPGGLELAWDETAVPVAVAPPPVAEGERVWVRYSRSESMACTMCGGFENRSLVIRDAPAGEVLWAGAEGHLLEAVDPALIAELFAVAVRYEPACIEAVTEDSCDPAVLVEADVVLETAPEQVVHRGELATVSTPGGTFDVVWTESEARQRQAECMDGPVASADRAFAVSRRR